jgi:hypothetical protein
VSAVACTLASLGLAGRVRIADDAAVGGGKDVGGDDLVEQAVK